MLTMTELDGLFANAGGLSSLTDGFMTTAREIVGTKSARELFGSNEKRARIKYGRMTRTVHPDLNHNAAVAQRVMSDLNARWAEYTGTGSETKTAGDGTKAGKGGNATTAASTTKTKARPRELLRTDGYVMFAEADGSLLVVRRTVTDDIATGGKELADAIESFRDVLAGSPVAMPKVRERLAIAQTDGTHEAARADAVDVSDLIPLSGLAMRLPDDKLDPHDAAWIMKRVLFLYGALAKCGLCVDKPLNSVCVSPSEHLLVVTDPLAVRIDADGKGARRTRDAMLRWLRNLIGNDADDRGISARMVRAFATGCIGDDATSVGELLAEFDDLCVRAFGGICFHEMLVTAPVA